MVKKYFGALKVIKEYCSRLPVPCDICSGSKNIFIISHVLPGTGLFKQRESHNKSTRRLEKLEWWEAYYAGGSLPSGDIISY